MQNTLSINVLSLKLASFLGFGLARVQLTFCKSGRQKCAPLSGPTTSYDLDTRLAPGHHPLFIS